MSCKSSFGGLWVCLSRPLSQIEKNTSSLQLFRSTPKLIYYPPTTVVTRLPRELIGDVRKAKALEQLARGRVSGGKS